jgi:hypothetical protein
MTELILSLAGVAPAEPRAKPRAPTSRRAKASRGA